MGITINTNVSSLLAQQYLSTNQTGLSRALNRLSSGFRINSAKDDAAGLAIAQHMQESSMALRQGSRNANDGVSLVQTAQTAMQESLNMLQRMREISSQASTGTYQSSDLANLDKEFQALKAEVGRISAVTSFNGVNLLDGSSASLSIQVGDGATANDRITITLTAVDLGSTGLNISGEDVTTNSNAETAMDTLTSAINVITTGLAQLGANQSNLESAIAGNESRATNVDTAKSRIMDADFAIESSNLAKFNILNQSGIAMLAQANSSPQMVLQLLRG